MKKTAESFHFEGRFATLVKSKTSSYIKLELNPHDIPPELSTASPGQRYVVALSPLGDFDEDEGEGARVVQLAGILCRTAMFWKFLRDELHRPIKNEEKASEALKELTGVESRSEYRHDEEARTRFRRVHDRYEKFLEKEESRGAL